MSKLNLFQSTHPWRVRQAFKSIVFIIIIFQSTHPWRVRLFYSYLSLVLNIVFQSTHPWRVRLICIKMEVVSFSNFNPRTREGCDKIVRFFLSASFISIHAPVKGATKKGKEVVDFEVEFQSTHPWRVRQTESAAIHASSRFQSTHPWRVRPSWIKDKALEKQISIHAPVKGATFIK